MFREVLPHLLDHDKMLMFDTDILFAGSFDFDYAMRLTKCSFYPHHPPLVVQPLIHEHTQDYSFVMEDNWRGKNVLVHTSRYIEIQVGFYDAKFFRWFTRNVIALMEEYHLVYGSVWGSHDILCNAAREYAITELGWEGYNTPCALLTGSASVFHLDTHAIEKGEAHFNRGRTMKLLYSKMFPSWDSFAGGVDYHHDPDYAGHEDRNKAVKNIDKECVLVPRNESWRSQEGMSARRP